MFILRYDDRVAFSLRHLNRDNLFGQYTGFDSCGRFGLRTLREGILSLARHLIALCHILARLGHGIGAVIFMHLAIYETPADGCVVDFRRARERFVGLCEHHRRTAHAFHAASNGKIHLS